MRPLATFHYSFFSLSSSLLPPHPFFLLITPSSSSLLPPRHSFLLVTPSSSSLFFPRPALSKSIRIRKSPFYINFDESITNRPTDQRTDRRTRPLIEMRTHLKRKENKWTSGEQNTKAHSTTKRKLSDLATTAALNSARARRFGSFIFLAWASMAAASAASFRCRPLASRLQRFNLADEASNTPRASDNTGKSWEKDVRIRLDIYIIRTGNRF